MDLSPMRLAFAAGLSSLFLPGSLLLGLVFPRHAHQSLAAALWPNPWRMLLFYGPLLSAFTMLVWSQLRLQRGVKKNAWTEAELAPLRKRLEAPVWIWLYLAAFAALIAIFAWSDKHAAAFLIMIFPLQTVLNLRNLVIQKKENSDGLLNLTTSSPVRSEDWGHRIGNASAE